MAELKPSRVLNLSNSVGNDNPQQYVEVGSNMFLGTQDGIKYTLVCTSDSKLHLVEALSDSNTSILSPKRSFTSEIKNEKQQHSHDAWNATKSGPKLIKLMALKPEQSPCKGQGDEIGNSVISPPHSVSSFKETEKDVGKKTFQETPTDQKSGSELTYITLLPKQEEGETSVIECQNNTYYPSPESSHCNYSTDPVAMKPPRYTRRPRPQLSPGNFAFSPIPRIRGTPRQRRPRRRGCQYNSRILHSTPKASSRVNIGYDSRSSVSDSLSGSEYSPNFNKCQSSLEYPRVPNNTPSSTEVESVPNQQLFTLQWVPHMATGVENYVSLDPRETHNEKERKRRLRIKVACHHMRALLPCLSDKHDNASVFEQAVSFISFMRETVGSEHDIEYIEKMFPF